MFSIIRKPGSPLPLEYLLKIEDKYKIRFPEILRVHYLQNNGAAICSVDATFHGEEFNVARILDASSIERLFDDWEFSREYVPFASDWGDAIYCWRAVDGMVFVLYADGEEYKYVTDSLEDFFETLESYYAKQEDM